MKWAQRLLFEGGTHLSPNPTQPGLPSEPHLCHLSLLSANISYTCSILSNSFKSVQLLLSCLVAVYCPAEVGLFCFDKSVVTLFRRASVDTTLPSFRFPTFSVFLYPHIGNYCEYCISSFDCEVQLWGQICDKPTERLSSSETVLTSIHIFIYVFVLYCCMIWYSSLFQDGLENQIFPLKSPRGKKSYDFCMNHVHSTTTLVHTMTVHMWRQFHGLMSLI